MKESICDKRVLEAKRLAAPCDIIVLLSHSHAVGESMEQVSLFVFYFSLSVKCWILLLHMFNEESRLKPNSETTDWMRNRQIVNLDLILNQLCFHTYLNSLFIALF